MLKAFETEPPLKRRKSSEVQAAKKEWERRIELHFRRVLEENGWPDYVDSEFLSGCFLRDSEATLPVSVMKRNATEFMGKCQYVKMVNPNSKSGAWRKWQFYVTVYKRSHLVDIGNSELKQRLA